MQLSWSTVLSACATAVWVLSLCCIPLVLVRRKDAPSAIAWILALVFLPFVSIILFWFFGRDRIHRPVRGKGDADARVRRRIRDLQVELPTPADLPTLAATSGVMSLAVRVGRRDVVPGNAVDVLVGADESFSAKLEAIEQARDHVHLEYFIIRADETGRRFRDALVRAAKRGVHVRVLYDAFGSPRLRRTLLRPVIEAGGEVGEFFPLDPIRRAWSVNMRNHRKLIVVDGRLAFTGGINLGDDFRPWRDLHLRIAGPAVQQLQTVFLEDWHFATGREVLAPEFFPVPPAAGESVLQIVDSAPDYTIGAIHHLYFAAIASAQRRVYITTPYFVPDRAILAALQTAALRGVDVRVILPRQSNHRVTFHAGRSFYDELLQAGVQIYEYLPNLIHTKSIVVDGDFATVGSANIDVRSFRYSFELISVIWDERVVRRLERIFLEDLGRTELVELDRWRNRGAIPRLKEGFGRLCAPLL